MQISLCTQICFIQTDVSPVGDLLVAQLRSEYNLLPKPIYCHPAGMKPSRKPAELSQHPEKPLHFTPHPFPTMQPSHCRALIAVLIYFNRVVHPRPDGAKKPISP